MITLAVAMAACSCLVRAQNTDSLKRVLWSAKKADTTSVGLMARISAAYTDVNFDSMLFYAGSGLGLAQTLHYEKGWAYSLRLLGLGYEHKNEYEKAIAYFKDALVLYEQLQDKGQQTLVLRSIAGNYYRLTNYQAAIDYNNKSIVISSQNNDLSQEGLALIDIGGIYTDQTNFSQALNYYLQGLKVFEQIADYRGMSLSLVNIATVYSGMGNYKMAEEYLNKAIPINENLKEREVVFANILNMGVVYGDMKNYARALSVFNKAAILADSIGDKGWENMVRANIADAYYHLGDFDTSFAIYKTVLEQAKELNDTNVLIMSESYLGRMLVKKGRTAEGLQSLLQSLAIARKKQMNQYIFDIAFVPDRTPTL